MKIDMYDEENIDLETELYNREIIEEQDIEEQEENSESDEIQEDDINHDMKINKNTFIYEQSCSNKKRKQFIFMHKPTNIIYEAELIGQDVHNSDKFCFFAKEYKSKNDKKIKIFKYQDLKNIRYK